ncbi:hypothetical protein FHX69_4535 [Prauserella muralis]|nr:hypothetical protein FHX69_4535 [Prauserella muralis]
MPRDAQIRLVSEHGTSSWVLSIRDGDGSWRQQDTMPASPRTGTLRDLVEHDRVPQWVAGALGVLKVCLRLAETSPLPVWRVAAQQVK